MAKLVIVIGKSIIDYDYDYFYTRINNDKRGLPYLHTEAIMLRAPGMPLPRHNGVS